MVEEQELGSKTKLRRARNSKSGLDRVVIEAQGGQLLLEVEVFDRANHLCQKR